MYLQKAKAAPTRTRRKTTVEKDQPSSSAIADWDHAVPVASLISSIGFTDVAAAWFFSVTSDAGTAASVVAAADDAAAGVPSAAVIPCVV